MSIRLSGTARKALGEALKADIDAYCKWKFTEGHRDHLGASIIGQECLRRLIYSFRHMCKETFDGRMLRLFNRGHKEEFRFVEWFRGIGCNVREVAENGKQFRISAVHGHYGGSLDGRMYLPERYNVPIEFLLEMKTHKENSFKRLVKNKLRVAKPEHYVQMCAYGEAENLEYGVYIATNKNDDDIYIEVVDLDFQIGVKHRNKALAIIGSTSLPPKIAASPAYDTCKYCPMVGVCHLDKPVDVNCRSCRHSSPVENASWYCEKWKAAIPKDAIPQACGQWEQFE